MEKQTILVVENEVVIAMDLQATLIELGHDVPEIATSAKAAIQTALKLHPDLILMDIHLSEALDGIDAAAEITKTLDIPIIYLTAQADEETLKRASHTSSFGYILKPFEARYLSANIEIAISKHRFDKTIKENRRWLLAVLNSISEGVAASDTNGLIKFMNPVAEALSGWSQTEAVGRAPAEVFHFVDEVTRKLLENPLAKSLEDDSAFSLPEGALLRAKTGHETPVADSTAPIHNDRGQAEGAVMVVHDSTEQRRMEAQLAHNALHDALTQLPNRILFLDRLQQAVEQGQRSPEVGFVVMLIDLDRFQTINDTLGHLSGDQLLIEVAPRLQTCLRAMDTVARFGGDEFAVLLEGVTDIAVACRTAECILDALKKPFTINHHELVVTASIGIVMSSTPYEELTDLLRNADIAMYRVKARGRSDYELFDMVMHSQARELMEREHALRYAITHDELQVHYQPIVSLATHEVASLEALVRWQKPSGDMVYPDHFIHLAEEMGIITTIDQWVLHQACLQLKSWQQLELGAWVWADGQLAEQGNGTRSPLAMSINVNLSSKHFAKKNLVDTVASILQDTGLSGHCLKLEVTESVFIDNPKETAAILNQLKQLNVQIYLDDFGTGYSSFSCLHQFPIDLVKIDRSFVQDIDTSPQRLEIVRAIIGLCHTLGMVVTAEGIETPQQRDILCDLGCEYGQGYLFARPTDGTTITRGLASSGSRV